jgi:hypothetical protein
MMKKTKTIRKKLLFFVLFITLAFAFPARAQVTVGNEDKPDSEALLDLKQTADGVTTTPNGATIDATSTKGLLLPRVSLTALTDPSPLQKHVQGMFVYNYSTKNDVTPGIYYNDGTQWVRVIDTGNRWFYMPSFKLPLEVTSTNGASIDSPATDTAGNPCLTFNLYQEYVRQFSGTATDNLPGEGQTFSSDDTYKNITPGIVLYTSDELIFYVTAYSDDVINVTKLDIDGTLHYTVVSNIVPDGSFINVIFRVK